MLKNVKYHSGKCSKRIVFNRVTGLPNPVGRVDKNVKIDNPYAGTYQIINNDDLIVRCIWENGKPEVTMEIVNDTGRPIESIDFAQMLISLNPLWVRWLTSDDGNLFLPKGCGWDGVFSENDKLKYVILQENLPSGIPQELVDKITNACYFTSLKEVDKPWTVLHAGLTPAVPVSSEYEYVIEEFNDGTVEVTKVTQDLVFQVTKDTTRYLLIKFIPLKMKGAEKMEWNTIKINH